MTAVASTKNQVWITFRKEGRISTVEAFAPEGKVFSGGEHSLVESWPHGGKREMVEMMKRRVVDDGELLDCSDPDCDICHDFEESDS